MQSGIFLASQISINIPAPGFGNRGRCNLKGEELGRKYCSCGRASRRLEMIFDQLLPFNFYFVKCTEDPAVAYFERINYSMIQRGVYSLYISTNLCLEVTNLSPSLAVYPGVMQPQLESRNLSSIHATSTNRATSTRKMQPQLMSRNLNSNYATSTRITQPQLESCNLNSRHATSAQFTQPLL